MQLKHLEDFQKVLADYHASEKAKQIIKELKLVLLLAPTSAGKNTIIRHLTATGRYHHIVSDTTRPPRVNDGVMEQNGKEYWFRTEAELLEDLKAGAFLEAEIIHGQQVSGISILELQRAVDEHKIAINDVDIKGVHNICRIKPDTVAVVLVPPSFDEWQARLAKRGVMPLDEQRRRFETSLRILQDGLKEDYYQYVISEDLQQSGRIIDDLVEGKPNPHQARGRQLIDQIRLELETKLKSMA